MGILVSGINHYILIKIKVLVFLVFVCFLFVLDNPL